LSCGSGPPLASAAIKFDNVVSGCDFIFWQGEWSDEIGLLTKDSPCFSDHGWNHVLGTSGAFYVLVHVRFMYTAGVYPEGRFRYIIYTLPLFNGNFMLIK